MGFFGGSSKSSSSNTQITNTSDNRIAATDNALVFKDSFQHLTNLDITDGGAISANERIALAAIESSNNSQSQSNNLLDRLAEFMTHANETATKTTTDTTGAQKLMPWLVAGVAVVALSYALRRH